MKATFTILATLICVLTFGQNNLFSTGDFGMRYGVGYSGSVTQQIRLSGIVAKNIEFGAGFTFTYTANNNSSSDSTSVDTYTGHETAFNQLINKSQTITTNIVPFVAYHFPLKGNVDLYAGLFTGFGLSKTFASSNINTTTAANYEEQQINSFITPYTLNAGGGVLAGFQYFFHKHFAIGAEASVGGRYNFSSGKQVTNINVVNSGTANPNSSYSSQNENHTSTTSFNLSTTGNVAICLTMYIGKHPFRSEVKMSEPNM